jgi:HAD superfamily hydrolase (TIGR01509 family)
MLTTVAQQLNTTSRRIGPGHYSAVIFDMDGLMFDTERLYEAAMREVGAEMGAPVTHELFLSLVGRGWTTAREILVRTFGAGFDIDRFAAGTDRHVMQAIAANGVPHKPGLVPLLEALRTLGVPLAVATSTHNPRASRKLEDGGIRSFFEHVVTGDQVTHGKPAPDIYLLAAQRLGVAPADALALEDSPNGARAATSAGIATLLVPDLALPDEAIRSLVTAILPDLVAVRHWLKL